MLLSHAASNRVRVWTIMCYCEVSFFFCKFTSESDIKKSLYYIIVSWLYIFLIILYIGLIQCIKWRHGDGKTVQCWFLDMYCVCPAQRCHSFHRFHYMDRCRYITELVLYIIYKAGTILTVNIILYHSYALIMLVFILYSGNVCIIIILYVLTVPPTESDQWDYAL